MFLPSVQSCFSFVEDNSSRVSNQAQTSANCLRKSSELLFTLNHPLSWTLLQCHRPFWWRNSSILPEREGGRERKKTKTYYFNSNWEASDIFLSIPHKLVSNCTKSALEDLGTLKTRDKHQECWTFLGRDCHRCSLTKETKDSRGYNIILWIYYTSVLTTTECTISKYYQQPYLTIINVYLPQNDS